MIVDNAKFEELKKEVFDSISSTYLVNLPNDVIFQGDGQKYTFYTFFNRSLRMATSELLLSDLKEDLIRYEHNLVFADYRSDCSELCLRWQNRVYWTMDKYKNYDHLENALWRSGGLLHPNCRHTIDLYYEDLKDDLIVDKPDNYDQIRAEAKLNEQMRYNERQIRKYRERENKAKLYGNENDFKKANSKRREWEKKPHNRFRTGDYYNVF